MISDRYDVLVVGGGILGIATAMTLAQRFGCLVAVLEAEDHPAAHQTGHNSGVIHSGLYYTPGSHKARNCVEGRRRLVELCEREEIAHETCGKLVIATRESEIPRLDELERRGRANGLEGLERLSGSQIELHEPHARGIAALWVPQTGIVDYVDVTRAYARRLAAHDGEILLRTRVLGISIEADEVVAETDQGRYRGRFLVNCGGLQCDRIARLAGLKPKVRIVPFRGDYLELAEGSRHLLRNLIYPVPDPRFPFLGVHLTRRINGSVEAGPNAVLALRREGYAPPRWSLADAADTFTYRGFWLLAARYWRVGATELLRSGSPKRFARALRRFIPEITAADFTTGGCGIRAQALDSRGRLVDDFVIERGPRTLHVLNAPSPAATASLCIADDLADTAQEHFHLREPQPTL